MAYLVRYLDLRSSAVRQASVDASDAAAAAESIRAEGGQVLSVQRASWSGLRFAASAPARTVRRSRAEAALICKEIRALVAAGLSVVEALEALAAQQAAGTVRKGTVDVFAALMERLRAGRSLSSAIEDVGGFSPLLIASVRSSERTSNLVEALDAYLHYDEMVGVLERRIVSASLYPGIVVTLGLAVAIFLLWIVIPRFASLYGQLTTGAGWATVLLLRLSVMLKSNPLVIPSALALVGGLGVVASRGGYLRVVAAAVVRAVPALNRQARHFERARLFEAMSLLLKGGYSLHESLQMCQAMMASGGPRERVTSAQRLIEQGSAASAAFATAGLTDEVTQRLIKAGERGGDFGEVLKAIGQRHSYAFETFVERATRVVEPVLLLGVAVLIGGMVVLLYMPIFDIASTIR